MNNKELLVCILAKYPVRGNVKTRLAVTIGDDNAVNLYRELLLNTIRQVHSSRPTKHVIVASTDFKHKDELISLLKDEVDVVFLNEKSLSSLICKIFDEYLSKQQYKKVVVMCSDSPFIDAQLIEWADRELEKPKTVFIAPSSDGGYSLIGLSNFTDLFSSIVMSRGDVFENTIALAKKSGFDVRASNVVDDVDTLDDVLSSFDKLNNDYDPQNIIRNQLKNIIEKHPVSC